MSGAAALLVNADEVGKVPSTSKPMRVVGGMHRR
jgi:hypothetical protein